MMDELIKLLMDKTDDVEWARIRSKDLYYLTKVEGTIYIEVYHNRLHISDGNVGRTIKTPEARHLWTKLNDNWAEQNKQLDNALIETAVNVLKSLV
jgi:hypothetical protein